eukprot:6932197-Prymnesium_polylepis.1
MGGREARARVHAAPLQTRRRRGDPPRRRIPVVPGRHAPPHTASRRRTGRCARAAHPSLLRRSV